MFPGSLFQPVRSISPDEVRNIIKEKTTDEYCLVDVRQPVEYEQGHIPGARLIPLGELQDGMRQMQPGRFTIVYCRSGNRSRSAAGLLGGAGFDDVFNMEGGILAYNGLVAAGPPEAGVFCFPSNLTPSQLVAVAWFIEDGSKRYLGRVQSMSQASPVAGLLDRLAEHKDAHKRDLAALSEKIGGKAAAKDFPAGILPAPPGDVMAGCVSVSDALTWSKGRGLAEILDLLMALEANTFDLYLKLARQVTSGQAKKVFSALAEEQSRQLDSLAAVFEKNL